MYKQEKGWSGIKDIRKMNISLLCKWWWRLDSEERLWQNIVRAKYLQRDTISSVNHRIDDSHVWAALLKVKPIYLAGRQLKVKNGNLAPFSLINALGDKALRETYPILFDWCTNKKITVYAFLEGGGHISFDRWLPPILFNQWLQVLDRVYSFSLENNRDIPVWKWNKSGSFTTKSVYERLTSNDQGNSYKYIWRANLPYKIKIFIWLLELNAVLTKENMTKRNWVGGPSCYFCSEVETTDHLFFACPVARVVWGIVGRCLGGQKYSAKYTAIQKVDQR